jgi:hypothetical protein
VVNNCKSCHFIMFDTHNSCDLGVDDNLCRKYDNNYRYTVRNVLKCSKMPSIYTLISRSSSFSSLFL